MKHTKLISILMAIVMLMGVLTVPAGANTGGIIHGGPADATDIMPSVDWLFKDQVQFMGELGINVRADYDAMTFEYLDKNGQPLGYKTVLDADNRVFITYSPDGKVLKNIDWSADDPFATAEYVTPAQPETTVSTPSITETTETEPRWKSSPRPSTSLTFLTMPGMPTP